MDIYFFNIFLLLKNCKKVFLIIIPKLNGLTTFTGLLFIVVVCVSVDKVDLVVFIVWVG